MYKKISALLKQGNCKEKIIRKKYFRAVNNWKQLFESENEDKYDSENCSNRWNIIEVFIKDRLTTSNLNYDHSLCVGVSNTQRMSANLVCFIYLFVCFIVWLFVVVDVLSFIASTWRSSQTNSYLPRIFLSPHIIEMSSDYGMLGRLFHLMLNIFCIESACACVGSLVLQFPPLHVSKLTISVSLCVHCWEITFCVFQCNALHAKSNVLKENLFSLQ